MKKVLLSICIVVMIFSTTGCGKVAKLENGQDAVVTLEGYDSISANNLYDEIKEKYAISVLIDMIDEKILNEKYPQDEEEKDQIEAQISSWLKTYGSEAVLLQQTQSAFGVSTMEDLRSYLSLQYKRSKAVEDYAKSLVKEDEIQKYYDEEIFGDIKASHILIKPVTNSSMTEEEKNNAEQEALEKAKNLIEQLNNGADFATLAKENSDDGSKDNGGDVGYFTHGSMTEEFEDAAKNLEVGKYTTEPVKTEYGYHIILKTDQKEKPTLESVKDDIIEDLAEEKLTDDATINIKALMDLRETAGMNIQDTTLKNQYDILMQNSLASAAESNENS